ncbi:hypothetical protein Tco_0591343 [Tanacetum coccineum]
MSLFASNEHLLEIREVGIERISKYRKIIHENFHGGFKHVLEDGDHAPLKSGWCVAKTKRHTLAGVSSIRTSERGLFLIGRVEENDLFEWLRLTCDGLMPGISDVFQANASLCFLRMETIRFFSSSWSRADMTTGRRESFSRKAYSRCSGRGIYSILIAMNSLNSWSRSDSLIFPDVVENGLESSSNVSNSSSITSS